MTSNQEENEKENENENEKTNDKGYEILREDFPNYDLSFKIIVIGNSGKIKIILFITKLNRSWKIMLINSSHKAHF